MTSPRLVPSPRCRSPCRYWIGTILTLGIVFFLTRWIPGRDEIACEGILRAPQMAPHSEDFGDCNGTKREEEDVVPPSCEPKEPQIIIYNRIPKAGSTTLMTILEKLADRNNYNFVTPEPYHDHWKVKRAIAKALDSGGRTVICNHFNFPEILYGKDIAYVNILRNPVDKCVSTYYYARYGYREEEWKEEHVRLYGNQTLDECMALPSEQWDSCLPCSFKMMGGHMANTMALMLCGRDDGECEGLDADEQLQRAWQNVLHHYAVIGITEDLSGSVKVLEHVFPSFFEGMSEILETMEPQKVTSYMEEYVSPSDETKKNLAIYSANDVKLYERVKDRFERQLKVCEARQMG